MPAPADFTQYVRECVVATLDTAPLLVALTGRGSDNVVSEEALLEGSAPRPMVGYSLVATPAEMTDYRVELTCTVVADDEATLWAMADAVDQSLTNPRLAAAVAADGSARGLEAYREHWREARTPLGHDDELQAFALQLDFVLIASRPAGA